jgi:hypothetical protein
VSFIILGVERIALGLVRWITVLAIKRPEIGAGVQFEGPLDVDYWLKLVEVNVSKEGKHAGGHQDDKEVLEKAVQEPERVRTPGRSKLGA